MSKARPGAVTGRAVGHAAADAIAAAAAAVDPRQQMVDASSRLGLTLADQQLDKLLAYRELLLRWNRVYNLTALRDPAEVLSHHLIDCLAVVPALRRHAAGRPLRVLDVGSGGGLPGVVVALLQPDWHVTCVDTVAKKVAFIRQAGGELRLGNLIAAHSRVEAMAMAMPAVPATGQEVAGQPAGPERGTASVPGRGHGPFDLITSRAFASLSDFVTLTADLLTPQGVWAAMKGKPTSEELAEVPAGVNMFHVEPIQVPDLDAQRCLVWMRFRSSD